MATEVIIISDNNNGTATVEVIPVDASTNLAEEIVEAFLDASNDASNMEQVLASSADQNLYFLQLQEQMAAENRQYSALSNVLKARHETVKNAIGNIR